MSRYVTEDFARLVAFLEQFRFDQLLADAEYIARLRGAHSKLLALVTVAAELRHEDGLATEGFLRSYGAQGDQYLGEVVSDCTESLLCLAQGCNRAAVGALRSSIESFAKAFAVQRSPQILTCTSVPEVFTIAGAAEFFTDDVASAAFAELKNVYSQLNLFVHTVGAANMFGIPAVGTLPCHDALAAQLLEVYGKTVRLFLLAIIGARRDLYDAFDHRNKEIAFWALTRDQRRLVFGVRDK